MHENLPLAALDIADRIRALMPQIEGAADGIIAADYLDAAKTLSKAGQHSLLRFSQYSCIFSRSSLFLSNFCRVGLPDRIIRSTSWTSFGW